MVGPTALDRYSYSGTSPYGHLTSKTTSQLQSPWLSPKLYFTVQITPCNKVTSPLRSLLPSPVGDLNSDVPLYLTSTYLISSSLAPERSDSLTGMRNGTPISRRCQIVNVLQFMLSVPPRRSCRGMQIAYLLLRRNIQVPCLMYALSNGVLKATYYVHVYLPYIRR